MSRPDWRAMLAGMSSTEYADWRHFYRTHFFQDTQLDMHFAGMTYAVLSLFFADPEMHPSDFSLLREPEKGEKEDDDALMQKATGLAGGVRYGPDGVVVEYDRLTPSVPEDDAMLMTVSEGIAGGVRYVG